MKQDTMFEFYTPAQLSGLGIENKSLAGKAPFDVYEFVAKKFLDSLKSGSKKWTQEWAKIDSIESMNLVSKKPYNGFVNKLTTSVYASDSMPYFLSEKQVKDKKGTIISKTKFCWIFFFTKLVVTKKSKTATGQSTEVDKTIGMPRFYKVYHQSNISGITFPEYQKPQIFEHEQIQTAQAIIDSMPNRPAFIKKDKNRAFYLPQSDQVNMPDLKQFALPQSYYATFFHELVHSTKHNTRLGERKTQKHAKTGKYDAHYAYEELIAEIGAVFLCSDAGIMNFTFENSTAYVQGWLKQYTSLATSDPNAIYNAIKEATKAAKFINSKNRKVIIDTVRPFETLYENEIAQQYLLEFSDIVEKTKDKDLQKKQLEKYYVKLQNAIGKNDFTKANKFKLQLNRICSVVEKHISLKRVNLLRISNITSIRNKASLKLSAGSAKRIQSNINAGKQLALFGAKIKFPVKIGKIDKSIAPKEVLDHGYIYLEKGNASYGFDHIVERHQTELIKAKTNPLELTKWVFKNFNKIVIEKNKLILVVELLEKKYTNVIIVSLVKVKGSNYYRIVSAGWSQKDDIDKKKVLLIRERTFPNSTLSGSSKAFFHFCRSK